MNIKNIQSTGKPQVFKEDLTYSNNDFIRFTKIKDLKYQILKNNKTIVTKNNTYYIDTKNTYPEKEKRYNSCEKTSKEATHKNEIFKLNAPYNLHQTKVINYQSDREKKRSKPEGNE